jgi:hypothetical protein
MNFDELIRQCAERCGCEPCHPLAVFTLGMAAGIMITVFVSKMLERKIEP